MPLVDIVVIGYGSRVLSLPPHLWTIRYVAARYPGRADGLAAGANCQHYAYEVLRWFGFVIGDHSKWIGLCAAKTRRPRWCSSRSSATTLISMFAKPHPSASLARRSHARSGARCYRAVRRWPNSLHRIIQTAEL